VLLVGRRDGLLVREQLVGLGDALPQALCLLDMVVDSIFQRLN
jgi:hypothetical protein